ncbi:MAG: glycosyltransferase family 10 domain-containing protein [Maricaulaceae bacterium]
MTRERLRVKFVARTPVDENPDLWLSLFKGRVPHIGNCDFIFDVNARDYDWLVAYDDLTFLPNEGRSNRTEELACARENTLFITSEPSSVKIYGRHFTRQFGHILTKQPREIIDHPNHIFQTPPLRWFYGRPLEKDDTNYLDVDHFHNTPPLPKLHDLSTVCSNKQMKHTLHHQRYKFVMELKARMGDDFNVFGRGIRPISDKAEAMDDYRFHIAIENHIEPGHWTEKISDCFLAYCIPLYYGPPDIQNDFPADSVIPIDIFDVDGALDIIRREVSEQSYAKRLPALQKAREMVLSKYNLMHAIAKIVEERHNPKATVDDNSYIYGRHKFRKTHKLKSLSDILHTARFKRHF